MIDVEETTKRKYKNDIYRRTERILYSYRDMVYITTQANAEHLEGTKEIIRVIEACLECIKDEPYADIIKYKYIEKLSDERISEIKYCNPSTITRHRKKLIKRISDMLFPKHLF